jgi:hypothetical protein
MWGRNTDKPMGVTEKIKQQYELNIVAVPNVASTLSEAGYWDKRRQNETNKQIR